MNGDGGRLQDMAILLMLKIAFGLTVVDVAPGCDVIVGEETTLVWCPSS